MTTEERYTETDTACLKAREALLDSSPTKPEYSGLLLDFAAALVRNDAARLDFRREHCEGK